MFCLSAFGWYQIFLCRQGKKILLICFKIKISMQFFLVVLQIFTIPIYSILDGSRKIRWSLVRRKAKKIQKEIPLWVDCFILSRFVGKSCETYPRRWETCSFLRYYFIFLRDIIFTQPPKTSSAWNYLYEFSKNENYQWIRSFNQSSRSRFCNHLQFYPKTDLRK